MKEYVCPPVCLSGCATPEICPSPVQHESMHERPQRSAKVQAHAVNQNCALFQGPGIVMRLKNYMTVAQTAGKLFVMVPLCPIHNFYISKTGEIVNTVLKGMCAAFRLGGCR